MSTIINITPTLRIRIEQDTDPESPKEWDNVGEITYNARSRYVLGTEAVDADRFHDIAQGIENGSLIGLPVYAYVHSGATIATKAFTCPWDSGRSGWVYCTKEKAITEFGNKVCTEGVRAKALKALQAEVETFNDYLTGDVYGYVIERAVDGGWDELDSCWGIYGLDYCKSEAHGAAQQYITEETPA